jgi:hypothetical protein
MPGAPPHPMLRNASMPLLPSSPTMYPPTGMYPNHMPMAQPSVSAPGIYPGMASAGFSYGPAAMAMQTFAYPPTTMMQSMPSGQARHSWPTPGGWGRGGVRLTGWGY